LYSVSTNAAGEVTGLHFEWPLLLPCILGSGFLIGWLIRSLHEQTAVAASGESTPVVPAPQLGLGRPAV
jgi:hypothetical protein